MVFHPSLLLLERLEVLQVQRLPYAFAEAFLVDLEPVVLDCAVLPPSDDLEAHLDAVESREDVVSMTEPNSSSCCRNSTIHEVDIEATQSYRKHAP